MAGCKYCTGVSYVFAEFPVINYSYIKNVYRLQYIEPWLRHRSLPDYQRLQSPVVDRSVSAKT